MAAVEGKTSETSAWSLGTTQTQVLNHRLQKQNGTFVIPITVVLGQPACFGVKPVLNWATVCSPNIFRTLRRIMIRFLIQL